MTRMGARLRQLALLALAALGTLAHAADNPLDPARFFGYERMSGASISPDGNTLAMAMAAPDTGRIRLVAMDLATRKLTVLASYADTDVNSFHWINDHRLVFDLVDQNETVVDHHRARGLYAVNTDGSLLRQLVNTQLNPRVQRANDKPLLPYWTQFLRPVGDGSDDVYVYHAQEGDATHVDYVLLQRLETIHGRVTDVEAPLHSFQWVFDAKGALRVAVTLHDNHREVLARDPATNAWSTLGDFARFFDDRAFKPAYLDADGRLFVEASNGGDTVGVFTYDLAASKMADKPYLVSPRYDLEPQFLVYGNKLAGLRYDIDAEVTQWVAPELQALQARIDKQLPATVNELSVPSGGSGHYVVIRAFSDHVPSLYLLYDKSDDKLLTLGNSRPDIDPRKMADMEQVHYTARDGLDIPAYLSVPRGAARKNLPLVLLVHGGPWLRGRVWGWDPAVQFLAAHGYAVLEPEFRGSIGYGQKLFAAGWKQWGLAMQDDLADGVKWAVAQGIVDPGRVCIMGASYGGYAVLMGLEKHPELYRCGVEWVGVSDIGLMLTSPWSDISDTSKKYGFPKLVGDPVADAAQFKATSPLANADKLHAPLLMAYGEKDRRVPLEHGERFRDAVMKNPGADVEWVVYENEYHGWHYMEHRIDFWTRVARFLDKNLAAK